MEVRLTDKGRDALGWGPDRQIATVSDHRAFAMMGSGLAVKDKNFMAVYAGNNPGPEKPDDLKQKVIDLTMELDAALEEIEALKEKIPPGPPLKKGGKVGSPLGKGGKGQKAEAKGKKKNPASP